MKIQQLIVDAYRCRGPLDDADLLIHSMTQAADLVGAQRVGEAQLRYVPHGVTAVLFLAESHILISTWPEHALAMVDVLLCNPQMNPYQAWQVMAQLLKPQGEVRFHEHIREIGAMPAQEKPFA
ncbi:adenosylmethionine decarboxylase proenzyme [Magnetococcus marinus MC-1]|uniref:Adenosylmethionine decarboxylase proenzyme n=1 Tax=Magnetococcus marinus (strain ATCC BAA-1437 / JCM 17883 / MC-1) TaxID=156889 RepID=A0LCH4_MAGMM|nr:adenosylmethionine decarboxylase [Magnetococcus marinus]ABK45667.1 adenosylmethionine decarboxylase proenzyme [Magnetococcus marinus MC-1]